MKMSMMGNLGEFWHECLGNDIFMIKFNHSGKVKQKAWTRKLKTF